MTVSSSHAGSPWNRPWSDSGKYDSPDLCDELDYDEAVAEHATLSHAMNVEPPERHHSEKSSGRKDKLQLSLAKCMLEALDMDRARALRMLDSYREKWLDVMESRDPQKIQTLDDYLVFRNLNGGMRSVGGPPGSCWVAGCPRSNENLSALGPSGTWSSTAWPSTSPMRRRS